MNVSVVAMTDHHVSFVRHALDSLLVQEVDFDFEFPISEACRE